MARASITRSLAKARDATGRDAATRALEHLLAAWKVVPAAPIADAIAAISAQVLATAKPPLGKTPQARNLAWDQAARDGDAAYRALLVATVTETKGNAETLARLELLVAHGPDPRVSAKIGDLIERPIYNASVSRTSAFWNRLFELLPMLGDPRLVQRAATWSATWRANADLNPAEVVRLDRRLEKVRLRLATAYGAEIPVLGAEDATVCAALVAAAAQPRPALDSIDGAELLAAVYANPDDDEARLIYADWLQERDDPHGELITLQIARARGTATKPQQKREKELLTTYWKQILGSLAPKVKKAGAKLERGFLVACTPFASTIDTDPGWATVRTLDGAVPASNACHLPALRALTSITDEHIRALAQLTKPLAVEELEYREDPGYHAAGSGATYVRMIKVLKLRRFSVDGFIPTQMVLADYDWAWTAPACAALEKLELAIRLAQAGMFLDALDATTIANVTLWGSCGPGDQYGTNSRHSWALLASRDAAGKLTELAFIAPRDEPRVEDDYGAEPLFALSELAPSRMTSLRVVVPGPMQPTYDRILRPRIDAELARFAITAQHPS